MIPIGDNVRMGGGKRGWPLDPRKLPRWILILGASGFVVVVIVVAVAILASSEEKREKQTGCRSNSDCGGGFVCAAGGCAVLIPTEDPDVWFDDVSRQLDTDPEAPKWKLSPAYGEKLRPTVTCPAPRKPVDPVEEGKILPLRTVRVFDLGDGPMTVYRYLKSRGSIWVGALRFWLEDKWEPDPKTLCVSRDIAFVESGSGLNMGVEKAYIDGNLERAVPADVEAAGAISYRALPPPADGEGVRTLSFDLNPVFLPEARSHTVVAIPLGSEVFDIVGAAPTQQRLFSQYIAYYWEHLKAKSKVEFRFRLATNSRAKLNIAELQP